MAVDEALATSPGLRRPILRLYRWQPRTISVGFHQNLDGMDIEKCWKAGIHIVRRPTGGRAILHAHEITYSVVSPNSSQWYSGHPREVYNQVSAALVNGLSRLSLPVFLERNGRASSDFSKCKSRFACFATSAKYEIQIGSRKMVGSAQRKYKSALLQHGSILLGDQHLDLVNYLKSNGHGLTARVRQLLEEKTVSIETILGRNVTYGGVAACIKQGFEDHFNISFQDTPLTPEEKRSIDRLRPRFSQFRRTSS